MSSSKGRRTHLRHYKDNQASCKQRWVEIIIPTGYRDKILLYYSLLASALAVHVGWLKRHGNEDINKGCRSIFNDPPSPLVWKRFSCQCLSFLFRICFLLLKRETCKCVIFFVPVQAKWCTQPAYTWLRVNKRARCGFCLLYLYLENNPHVGK